MRFELQRENRKSQKVLEVSTLAGDATVSFGRDLSHPAWHSCMGRQPVKGAERQFSLTWDWLQLHL